MKYVLRILGALAFLTVISARAQVPVPLQNFTSVIGPDTVFYGTWEATGSISGSTSPNPGFAQGNGVFDFTASSGTIPKNDVGSKVDFFFPSPVSIGSNLQISVAAQSLIGNLAGSFQVILFDSSLTKTATASFSTTSFPNGSYNTAIASLSLTSGFNVDSVAFLRITGGQTDPIVDFKMSFDDITAGVAPIPEPSTYAAIAGMAALGLAHLRRRKPSQTES